MTRAKLFMTGGSQAVRLLAEFRFEGDEVEIRRDSEGDEDRSTALHARRLPKIDKSVLTISEPKRHVQRSICAFVASQPCLICGARPLTRTMCAMRNPEGSA